MGLAMENNPKPPVSLRPRPDAPTPDPVDSVAPPVSPPDGPVAKPATAKPATAKPATAPPATAPSDVEISGRRYRLGVGDGMFVITNRRSGAVVATFMEDAFPSAWARYQELERERTIRRVAAHSGELAIRRWYVPAAIVLGALTVAYLKFEDPGLAPTAVGVARITSVRMDGPVARLGERVADRLTHARLAPPVPEPKPPKPSTDRHAAGGPVVPSPQPTPTPPGTWSSNGGGGGGSTDGGTTTPPQTTTTTPPTAPPPSSPPSPPQSPITSSP
jgi:hypothetical protein